MCGQDSQQPCASWLSCNPLVLDLGSPRPWLQGAVPDLQLCFGEVSLVLGSLVEASGSGLRFLTQCSSPVSRPSPYPGNHAPHSNGLSVKALLGFWALALGSGSRGLAGPGCRVVPNLPASLHQERSWASGPRFLRPPPPSFGWLSQCLGGRSFGPVLLKLEACQKHRSKWPSINYFFEINLRVPGVSLAADGAGTG